MRLFLRFVFLMLLLTAPAFGQGLRVSTMVYDAGRLDESGQEAVLSSSFSLFHNGRAYDYVEEADEVVVYNPVARRFVIINSRRGVFTTVPFVEIQSILKAHGPKTDEYIKELQDRRAPEAKQVARSLRFQQAPEFDTSFNQRSGLLSLRSASWKYSVSTKPWDDSGQVENYLSYADWTARLNYLLHPGSMYPQPRLVLNDEIRNLKDRLPVIVQRDLRPDQKMILRAEHQFVRNLTDRDRQRINAWDESLRDGSLKEIPLRKYQEAVLLSGR